MCARLSLIVSCCLVAGPATAQTARSEQLMQQKYTRLELSSEAVIQRLEEREAESVSVGLEQRGKDVVLQTQDRPLVVQNSAELSKYAQRIPYEYRIELEEAEGAAEDEAAVRATAEQLTAVKRWRETEFPSKAGFVALENAYRQLDEKALKVARADATDTEVTDFKEQLEATRRELARAYRDAGDSDPAAQRELLDNFVEVQRTGKALYGLNRDDRYPPETYQRIFQNSRGAIALLAEGSGVHCSGVLMARDYALTNQHCVDGFFPTELRVRFDYEERIDGNTLPTRTFPVAGVVPFNTSQRLGYDFAVLKIGVDEPDGNHAGDLYPVQCLSLARVRRDDPLYLIGHPLGDPRTVHDNTFVHFPFRVTELELTELEMAVRAEFVDADDELTRLQEFRASYRLSTANGVPVYENYSLRWREQPTIGVDSDTFHGNSGSPAYHRRTHQVVGILFDGEDDLDEPWNVGWRAHEAVLPIEVIVERLDDVHPDWRAWQGVCLQ